MAFDLQHYTARITDLDCNCYEGEITRVAGSIIEARGPAVGVGQLCEIHPRLPSAPQRVRAEVVGFRDHTTVLMPLEALGGVQSGDVVVSAPTDLEVGLSGELLGRVLDGLGQPIDNGPPIVCSETAPIYQKAPHPLRRPPIREVFCTNLRAIDMPLTLGKGQRVGVFSGSGVGKSTLLGEIARNSEADVNVIALVGERGREVREFIDTNLGEEGLAKSVMVVATADAPPLLKVKAAHTSTTIAEYLRECGMAVLYVMDSITRVANAQREIGLAAGEPPTTRGYPPSVFSLIPALAERLGNSERGSITGVYSVLVDGDDMTEPVADLVRATLDGHIVLSRVLADRGYYPAVDVLGGVSRVMNQIVSPAHLELARKLRSVLSTYKEAEDLIKIGAYTRGTSPQVDGAIELMPGLSRFLCQRTGEKDSFESALGKLGVLMQQWEF